MKATLIFLSGVVTGLVISSIAQDHFYKRHKLATKQGRETLRKLKKRLEELELKIAQISPN